MKMKNHQKGAAMVEFALVLPLFMVLVFATIEFSLMLYDKALITNASREAARSGIALRNPPLTATQLQAQTNTIMCQYLGKNNQQCPNGTNLLISFGTNDPATAPALLLDKDDNPASTPVFGETKVKVTVNYTYNTLVIGALLNLIHGSFSSTVAMSATSTMNSE